MKFLISSVVLFFLLSSFALALSVDSQTFEQGEPVFFTACDYQEVEVTCLEGELERAQWSDSCSRYLFDSIDITCTDPVIYSFGEENKSLQLYITDYRRILEPSLIASNEPLTLAKQVHAFYLLNNQTAVESLLTQLRDLRIEDRKCWGLQTCDIELTIDVLRYLSQSGVDRSRRVFQDPLLWVESRQTRTSYPDFQMTITSSRDAVCEVFRGASRLTTKTFENTTREDFSFDYDSNQELSVECDSNYCVYIFDQFGEPLRNECLTSNKDFSFQIDSGCWFFDSVEICSPLITGKALSINHLASTNFDRGVDWVEDVIAPVPIDAAKIVDTNTILSNIFIYHATGNPDIRTWLFYSQNNDGSFGLDDRVNTTLEAVYTFRSSRSEEWVTDAYDYLHSVKPIEGWNSLYEDLFALKLFGGLDTQLISPRMLTATDRTASFTILQENTVLEVDGPFELTLDADDPLVGSLRTNSSIDGLYTGYLLASYDDLFQRVPVSILRSSFVNIDIEDDYYIEPEGFLTWSVSSSPTEKSCEITFTDFFQNRTFDVAGDDSLVVEYSGLPNKRYEVVVSLNCETITGSVSNNYMAVVRTYEYPPFTVSGNFEVIDSQPGEVLIQNNLDEEIDVSLSFLRSAQEYEVDSFVRLPPNHRAQLFITRVGESSLNLFENNELIVSSLGYEERHPFEILLNDDLHEFQETIVSEISSSRWLLLFFGLIGVVVIVIISKYLSVDVPKQKRYQEELDAANVKKPSQKEKPESLGEVLAAVDEELGESPEEITSELKKEGFAIEEINKILEDLQSRMK